VPDDLATYAQTRDPELRGSLAVKHLPLVKFVARKMSRSLPAHMDLDDLVSWGSIGLLDAIDKFDPTRQVRFSTYAVTRIRGAILDGLQQMDWAPKQVTSKVRAVRRVQELLTAELGYDPTVPQVAVRMGLDEALVRRWINDGDMCRWRPLEAGDGDSEGGRHEYAVAPQTRRSPARSPRSASSWRGPYGAWGHASGPSWSSTTGTR
jgi:RNA polymerase sigma factor for flagellar operon FliA